MSRAATRLTGTAPTHHPVSKHNGFDLLGLNPLYEQITLGAILLIAVGIDAWSRLRTG